MTPAEFKAARNQLGVTQARLAWLLGYGDRARISDFEGGRAKPSTAAVLLLKAYLEGYRNERCIMTLETYSTYGPICPHCSHEHNPSEDPNHYYSERDDTSTCSSCGKDFKMEVFTYHSWTCEKFDD